jgi:hypothetical protein
MTELVPIRIPAFGRNLKPAGAVTVTKSLVLGAVFPITTATVVSTGLVSATEDSKLKPDKVGALGSLAGPNVSRAGPTVTTVSMFGPGMNWMDELSAATARLTSGPFAPKTVAAGSSFQGAGT